MKVSENINSSTLEVTKVFTKNVSAIYNGGGNIIFYRVGNLVQVNVRAMVTIPKNTGLPNIIPAGFRPCADFTSITKIANRLAFKTDGQVIPDNNDISSSDGYYSFTYPTSESNPA